MLLCRATCEVDFHPNAGESRVTRKSVEKEVDSHQALDGWPEEAVERSHVRYQCVELGGMVGGWKHDLKISIICLSSRCLWLPLRVCCSSLFN